MEIKEEKVVQTIKTYTFTEDEYHELIYKERKYGYTKAVEYIRHGYKMNNMYDLSFNEWLKENKE